MAGEGVPFIEPWWGGGSRRGSGGERIRPGAVSARARRPLADDAIGQSRRSSGWSSAAIGLGRRASGASGLSGGRGGGLPWGLGEQAEVRDAVGIAAFPADGRNGVGGAEPWQAEGGTRAAGGWLARRSPRPVAGAGWAPWPSSCRCRAGDRAPVSCRWPAATRRVARERTCSSARASRLPSGCKPDQLWSDPPNLSTQLLKLP